MADKTVRKAYLMWSGCPIPGSQDVMTRARQAYHEVEKEAKCQHLKHTNDKLSSITTKP